MSLGETIFRLRTEKNMSQGDLADALDVSRQSISKWETDASTPELDKLVRLSELFGVTLDELVTGRKPETPEAPEPKTVIVERQRTPGRKTAGIVLLCMAFVTLLMFTVGNAFWAGVLFGIPFVVCGLICLLVEKHPGLWCAWALYLMVDGYLRYGTGLNWSTVRLTFLWEESWNYTRLAVAWCQFLCGLGLLAGTVAKLRKGPPLEWTTGHKACFAAGCVLFLLLSLPVAHGLWQWGGLRVAGLVTFLGWLCDSLRLALLSGLLTAAIRGRKKKAL